MPGSLRQRGKSWEPKVYLGRDAVSGRSAGAGRRREGRRLIVEPIVLRDEDPPEDVVVVVRGGAMESAYLRRTALDAYDEVGLYTVSVFLAPDDSVEALCAREPYLLRYGKVRLSTVGALRAAGFAVIPRWPARTTTSYCPTSPLRPSAGWRAASSLQSRIRPAGRDEPGAVEWTS